jgi:hypothetical protein
MLSGGAAAAVAGSALPALPKEPESTAVVPVDGLLDVESFDENGFTLIAPDNDRGIIGFQPKAFITIGAASSPPKRKRKRRR